MTDESPACPVTTAARVRLALGRLLGPWGWASAILGTLIATFPGQIYQTPPAPELSGAGRGERTLTEEEEAILAVERHAAFSVSLDRPSGIHAAHLRSVEIGFDGPASSDELAQQYLRRDLHLPIRGYYAPPPKPDWVWEIDAPLVGLSLSRKYDFQGPRFSSRVANATAPTAWKTIDATVGIVWFLLAPLLWTLVRIGQAWRHGWPLPKPFGRWRRAVRPWAVTFGLLGAGLLWLGGTKNAGQSFGETRLSMDLRRDAYSPSHPRFVRLSVAHPLPPAVVPAGLEYPREGPVGWYWGDRQRGLLLERRNASQGVLARFPTRADNPRRGESLTSLDLSLWYVLLPAALWSGVVLWRTRPERMRSA
ncbi:hypothetical protein [Alienimonas chondri]|uniref:DUF3592 domain-containing protein n=1 Tax=Alienimonas chondri TaxID=2681879 RepID=A0ABX1VB77_9PLAN|nr:hypothetical protein [Alienimonas chondri]NNJ25196.1 hypothetical protein [Alienimonas chondri]